MYEQLDIFSYLRQNQERKEEKEDINILSVGDRIGKLVLGECRIATITEVEGLPDYPFYRTDAGCCYSVKDGEKSIDELLSIAEEERKKIQNNNTSKFVGTDNRRI